MKHAFAALRHPVYAVLWGATVVSNVGVFMRDVTSAWLVARLSDSPVWVALVQAAATLPIFLLAIVAGALTDLLDRRRFLAIVQLYLIGVSAALTTLALTDRITVHALVALTFLGGIGAALIGPAWQAIAPELVPRTELRSAIALNSMGFNVARAVGPAAGGALLGALGATATYGINTAGYLFVIAALLWWRRPPVPDATGPSRRWRSRYPTIADRCWSRWSTGSVARTASGSSKSSAGSRSSASATAPMRGAWPRTPSSPKPSWNGSSSNRGPSTCDSIAASPEPTPNCRRRRTGCIAAIGLRGYRTTWAWKGRRRPRAGADVARRARPSEGRREDAVAPMAGPASGAACGFRYR